ncbi:MAG: bile acid:sodium symporter [Halieaceae bacterium]
MLTLRSMFELYPQYEYWLAAVQLGLAMLGMGATLQTRDFAAVFLGPRALLIGLGVQLLCVPLIVWGLILLLSPAPGLAVGLALCAAIPGGAMSNVFTFLARGHIALSIALTSVTTLACLLTTPIILGLLIAEHVPASFVMPTGQIALEITLILLLPLVLGMLRLYFRPEGAERFARNCIRASIFCILLIVIGAMGSGRIDIEQFGLANLSVILLLALLLALFSWLLPRWLGVDRPDSTAINIEVTVRNGNLGLLIKASLFPALAGVADPIGDMVLFSVLVYGGFATIIGISQIYLHGYFNKRMIEQAD